MICQNVNNNLNPVKKQFNLFPCKELAKNKVYHLLQSGNNNNSVANMYLDPYDWIVSKGFLHKHMPLLLVISGFCNYITVKKLYQVLTAVGIEFMKYFIFFIFIYL